MSAIITKMFGRVVYWNGYRSVSHLKCRSVSSQTVSDGFFDGITPTIKAVQKGTYGLQIVINEGYRNATTEPLYLDYMWLLDNCRCPNCYDNQIFQRRFTGRMASFLSAAADPSQVEAWQPQSVVFDQESLHISWSNDHHSSYDFNWLKGNVYLPSHAFQKAFPKLWNGSLMKLADYPRLMYDRSNISKSGSGEVQTGYFAKQLLSNVTTYGFCLIEGVEPTEVATRDLVECFAMPQHTYYGGYWSVYQDNTKEDSAYSNVYVPPHNDCTYFSESPGLMVFHCLEQPASGGETVVVDGFYCSDQLRRQDVASYCYLSSMPIEACYFDNDDNHFSHCDTVLKHHPFTHNMLQVRFNPLDVVPVRTIRQEEIRSFYKSFGSFADILWDKSNAIQITLQPGTVLVFDNWRILHSRNAFVGNRRRLYGCYVSRTEFINRLNRAGMNHFN